MAPKKDLGKDPKSGPMGQSKAGFFTEVERTFLEIQIADCNRKIVRLKATVDDYEQRNEELQKAYEKLDEDRADIIAYLKKVLNNKNEENNELKEKVRSLEETREIETAEFKAQVAEIERNFIFMKDQLTSENKLLAGKLNTLEEFRATKDDLMKKFDKQEKAFADQELKYKRMIYDTEKKLVIGKDKLKKDMEARVLKLAQDYQDATELRIAASTHRVIRENIAINNELDSLLSLQGKLAEQNEKYKENERAARIAMEVAEEERDKAINKSIVQLKVIDRLSSAYQQIQNEQALMEKKNYDLDTLQEKVQILTKTNEDFSLQVRVLEQNFHARMSEQNKSSVEFLKIIKDDEKLKKILKEAACVIQAAMKLDQWATSDPDKEVMDRNLLLSRLLEIVSQYKDLQRVESLETIASLGTIYKQGDLGFIPKPAIKKSTVSTALSLASRDNGSSREDRRSLSKSISSSSLGSLKTIPSIKLVPPSKAVTEGITKVSLLSFATSTKSSVSTVSDEQQEELNDIEKQLEASKLEIQKSILRDLAYSQAQLVSQSRLDQEKLSKSVVIVEGEEIEHDEGDGTEGDQEKSEIIDGEHLEGEIIEDEGDNGEYKEKIEVNVDVEDEHSEVEPPKEE